MPVCSDLIRADLYWFCLLAFGWSNLVPFVYVVCCLMLACLVCLRVSLWLGPICLRCVLFGVDVLGLPDCSESV